MIKAFAIAAGLIWLCACSGAEKADAGRRDSKPDLAVTEVARADACRIMSLKDDTHALEGALLEARAKEQLMRSRGLESTADLYIQTIGQTVADSLPELATRMGI